MLIYLCYKLVLHWSHSTFWALAAPRVGSCGMLMKQWVLSSWADTTTDPIYFKRVRHMWREALPLKNSFQCLLNSSMKTREVSHKADSTALSKILSYRPPNRKSFGHINGNLHFNSFSKHDKVFVVNSFNCQISSGFFYSREDRPRPAMVNLQQQFYISRRCLEG